MKNPEENYLDINKQAWNKRTTVHVDSDFYNQKGFLAGKNSLNSIELDLLGDVSGKRILHLQCHFGQDSMSLSRMGAKVTGVDLSDVAIDLAKKTASQLGLDTEFICSDIYDLPNNLQDEFDIVFTSYGTIGWLPDVNKWAGVVKHFLKKGGKFVFAEFHPVVWMFDDDFKIVEYNYFNTEAIVENSEGTYTDPNSEIEYESVGWNHDLGEVLSALLTNDIEIKSFIEYNYSPYPCFRDTEEFEKGKFRIKHLANKIPMVYSILGEKK